jgi:hypothetical protein
VNSSLEALKKRRNRKYREYKKTGSGTCLLEAQRLSKKIKKELNAIEKTTIEKKAQSKDPRIFWHTVSELRNGSQSKKDLCVSLNGTDVSDGAQVSNAFGEFFNNKVNDLYLRTDQEENGEPHLSEEFLTFDNTEVGLVAMTLKSKKSCGIDGIPMTVVKDTEYQLRDPRRQTRCRRLKKRSGRVPGETRYLLKVTWNGC